MWKIGRRWKSRGDHRRFARRFWCNWWIARRCIRRGHGWNCRGNNGILRRQRRLTRGWFWRGYRRFAWRRHRVARRVPRIDRPPRIVRPNRTNGALQVNWTVWRCEGAFVIVVYLVSLVIAVYLFLLVIAGGDFQFLFRSILFFFFRPCSRPAVFFTTHAAKLTQFRSSRHGLMGDEAKVWPRLPEAIRGLDAGGPGLAVPVGHRQPAVDQNRSRK
jgi:hypothetical protein